ncbi:hypothetical protein [Spiroplasma endosymbiont of Aleiodes alternator]
MNNFKSYHCYGCYIRKTCEKSYLKQRKIIEKFNKIINRNKIKYNHGKKH